MFEAEADGLRELKSANALRVPVILACGIENGESFLELERFDFGRATAVTEAQLGTQLAALHRNSKDRFGWFRNNTIGLTPQTNDWTDDWIEFFRVRRLQFQLGLAAAQGYGNELDELGEQLGVQLPSLFENYKPEASLLHGDL